MTRRGVRSVDLRAPRKPADCVIIPPPDPSRLKVFGPDHVDEVDLWNMQAGRALRWQFYYRAFFTPSGSAELRLVKARRLER